MLLVLSVIGFLSPCALLLWVGLGRRVDNRLVIFSLALTVITYLPTINNAQFALEFLMRARLFMLPVAGLSIVFASLLLTDEKKRAFSLVAAGMVVLLCTGLTASNNKAWIAEAQRQASLEEQLWPILAKVEPNRPVWFLPASEVAYDAEPTKDHIETMFARWCYEHPGCDTTWRIICSAKLIASDQLPSTSEKPLFIGESNGGNQLTDISDQVFQKAKALSAASKLSLTTHEKTPTNWKWSILGLQVPDTPGIVLEGAMHTITVDQLYLHVPPEGFLDSTPAD